MSDSHSTPPAEEVDPKVKAKRESRLRWYHANKERAAAANKAWHQANRERKNQLVREWRKNNKDKVNTWKATWRKNHPEKAAAQRRRYRVNQKEHLKIVARRSHLRRCYGMTPADYEGMLVAQNGRCAICGTSDPSPSPLLCVDHCHKTGRVRGLLCFNCNVSIGRLGDDPERLWRAIMYLEEALSDARGSQDSSAPSPGRIPGTH